LQEKLRKVKAVETAHWESGWAGVAAGGPGRSGVAGQSAAVKNNAGKKVAATFLCPSG